MVKQLRSVQTCSTLLLNAAAQVRLQFVLAGQTQWERPTAPAVGAPPPWQQPQAASQQQPQQAQQAQQEEHLYLPAMQFGGARPGYGAL